MSALNSEDIYGRSSRRREHNATCVALEDGKPDTILHSGDGAAHRSLREVQLCRGAAEVERLRNNDDGPEILNMHGCNSATRSG